MANTYQFRLKNNKGKSILFYSANSVSENITINSISYSMPGQTSDKNISLNLGGFTKLISLNFILKDRGTDVSNGDNIITTKQQWDYIVGDEELNMDGLIQDTSISGNTTDLEYEIRIWFESSDGSSQYKYYTGTLEDVSIEPVEGETFLRGRLTLRQAGTNPLSIEID
ncbi:MAG: hypothetical protein EOL97_16930 [Spirochaetia bacterium]|nr:hypothetical protein [Spirochaetia bacterium]